MQRATAGTASKRASPNGHSTAPRGPATPKMSKVAAKQRQLPFEWRVWVAENRLLGTTEEQLSEVLSSSGVSLETITAEMDEQFNSPSYRIAERFAQRYNKLKSILEIKAQLSSLSFASQTVERRSKISRSEFLERYYSANRP